MLTPMVLLYAALFRPIRTVGPIVLTFMVVAIFGAEMTLDLY
jgi:hypothetical protein